MKVCDKKGPASSGVISFQARVLGDPRYVSPVRQTVWKQAAERQAYRQRQANQY